MELIVNFHSFDVSERFSIVEEISEFDIEMVVGGCHGQADGE